MTRPIQPATNDDVAALEAAADHLRVARLLVKGARAPKTLARLDATLSSLDGAIRHVRHRRWRTEEANP